MLALGLAFVGMVHSPSANATGFNLWRPACHTITLTDVQGPFDGIYGSFVSSSVAKTVGKTTCKPLNEWTLLMLPGNIDINTTREANPGITFTKTLVGLAIKTRQDPGTTRDLIIVTKRPVRVGQAYISQGGIILTAGLIQAMPGPSVAFGAPRTVVETDNNAIGIEFANGFTANRFALSPNSELENTIYAANATNSEGEILTKLQLSKSVDFGEYLPPLALISDPETVEFPGAVEMDAQNNVYSFYSKVGKGYLSGEVGDLIVNPRLHLVVTDASGVTGQPVEIFPDDDEAVNHLQIGSAIDGLGRLHVVTAYLKELSDDDGNVVGLVANSLYSRSEDGGATWSQPIVFESRLGATIYPSVAVSADGSKVMVNYFGYDIANQNPIAEERVATSFDGGRTFSTDVVAHTGDANYFNPFIKLAMDSNGTAYLSGTDDLDGDGFGDIFVIRSDDGVQWSSPVAANNKSTNVRSPIGNMAVGPEGQVDVVWSSDPDGDGNTDVFNHTRSVDGAATFAASQVVVTGGDRGANSRGIRYDVNGQIHLQYYLANGESEGVYEVIGQ